MTEYAGKTKPDLWKEIDFLKRKVMLLEKYLEKNGAVALSDGPLFVRLRRTKHKSQVPKGLAIMV